jgi:hypothetical protein
MVGQIRHRHHKVIMYCDFSAILTGVSTGFPLGFQGFQGLRHLDMDAIAYYISPGVERTPPLRAGVERTHGLFICSGSCVRFLLRFHTFTFSTLSYMTASLYASE